MTDDDELLAIIARDGPKGFTTDRKLLGAILTSRDYMVAGMFIPTDPEQAEEALIKGTGVVLWREKPWPLTQEIATRDLLHAASVKTNKSINVVFVEQLIPVLWCSRAPHEILAMLRAMPDDRRQWFIDQLPPHLRPKTED